MLGEYSVISLVFFAKRLSACGEAGGVRPSAKHICPALGVLFSFALENSSFEWLRKGNQT